MAYRILDQNQPGQCDPVYYDGSGVRFMTDAYITEGIQSWGRTPGYLHNRPKRLVTQSFLRYYVSHTFPRGKVDYFPTWDTSLYHRMTGLFDQYATWQPGLGAIVGNLDAEAADAEDEVKSKALQKLKDQKVSIGQNIGEWKSTQGTPKSVGKAGKDLLEGLMKTVGDVLDITIAAKRGQWGKVRHKAGLYVPRVVANRRRVASGRKKLESLADGWLLWSYGVRPILQDIEEAAKELGFLKAPVDFVHRIHATVGSHTTYKTTHALGLGGAWIVEVDHELLIKSKATIEFIVADQFEHNLSKWGIKNIAATAWELITLSFVIDWLIGIGTYLQNLDATSGLRFKSGTISSLVRNTGRGLSHGVTAGSWVYEGAGVSLYIKERMSRYPLSEFPDVPLPQLKNPFSVHHVTTAVALVVQKMR